MNSSAQREPTLNILGVRVIGTCSFGMASTKGGSTPSDIHLCTVGQPCKPSRGTTAGNWLSTQFQCGLSQSLWRATAFPQLCSAHVIELTGGGRDLRLSHSSSREPPGTGYNDSRFLHNRPLPLRAGELADPVGIEPTTQGFGVPVATLEHACLQCSPGRVETHHTVLAVCLITTCRGIRRAKTGLALSPL